jgi:hypothetical protein
LIPNASFNLSRSSPLQAAPVRIELRHSNFDFFHIPQKTLPGFRRVFSARCLSCKSFTRNDPTPEGWNISIQYAASISFPQANRRQLHRTDGPTNVRNRAKEAPLQGERKQVRASVNTNIPASNFVDSIFDFNLCQRSIVCQTTSGTRQHDDISLRTEKALLRRVIKTLSKSEKRHFYNPL